jgi:hypothetical protein
LNDTSEVLSTPIGRLSHARHFTGLRNSGIGCCQPKSWVVVNARTAKQFGIGVPPTLLTLADEVIE